MGRPAGCCRCCRRRWPENTKVLVVAIVLFTTITAVQFVAAIVSNSNALLVDCASMLVDAVTYAGNLHTECAASDDDADRAPISPRDLARRALVTSGVSIVVLYGITLWGLSGAVEDLTAGRLKDDLEADVVLVFGVLGVVFDGLVLAAFRKWGPEKFGGQGDKAATTSPSKEEISSMTENGGAADETTAPPDPGGGGEAESSSRWSLLNMGSALSHVVADSVRSLTSIALGLTVMLDRGVNGSRCDAIATLVISSTIIFGNIELLRQWGKAARTYFRWLDALNSCAEDADDDDRRVVHDDETGGLGSSTTSVDVVDAQPPFGVRRTAVASPLRAAADDAAERGAETKVETVHNRDGVELGNPARSPLV